MPCLLQYCALCRDGWKAAMSSLAGLLSSPWLSPTAGPIRRIWCTSCGGPDPRWWVFGTEMARAPLGTYWSPAHVAASGSSIDRREALFRALGETVERHASMHAIHHADEVMIPVESTSIADRFARCAPDEACPPLFRGVNRDRPIGHVRMEVLADGTEVHVPTPYVHLGYMASNEDELATFPISTGTAFSEDLVQALWRGLCETAERDAIMLFWLSRSGFRQIDVEPAHAPSALVERLARLAEADLSVRLLDISTDFPIPVVLAIVSGREYPFTTVGASCHQSLERACCKALDEAVSVRVSLRHEKWQRANLDFEEFDWVRRLEDHMVLYGSWPESPALAFLDEAPGIPLATATREYAAQPPANSVGLAGFASRLREELGLTVLASELECSDTAPFGHVVRVVVPEMMPLSQDHRARWLDTPRLHRRLSAGGEGPNPYPHPFA